MPMAMQHVCMLYVSVYRTPLYSKCTKPTRSKRTSGSRGKPPTRPHHHKSQKTNAHNKPVTQIPTHSILIHLHPTASNPALTKTHRAPSSEHPSPARSEAGVSHPPPPPHSRPDSSTACDRFRPPVAQPPLALSPPAPPRAPSARLQAPSPLRRDPKTQGKKYASAGAHRPVGVGGGCGCRF